MVSGISLSGSAHIWSTYSAGVMPCHGSPVDTMGPEHDMTQRMIKIDNAFIISPRFLLPRPQSAGAVLSVTDKTSEVSPSRVGIGVETAQFVAPSQRFSLARGDRGVPVNCVSDAVAFLPRAWG